LRRASEQARFAEADLQLARQEARRHPSRANNQRLDDAIAARAAATAREWESADRLRVANQRWQRAHDEAENQWARRRHDPPVGPAGESAQGAGYEDPRCQGQRQAAAWGAPWSDVCRGEDGQLVDFKECHRRMTDSVYAATGGRCWQEPDPADGTRVVCREPDVRRQDAGNAPGGDANPGFIDPTPWKRPSTHGAGTGTVPSPVQTLRDQMCAKGRCPDPLPFNAAAPRASTGNSRWSNSKPPGRVPSPGRMQRPTLSTGTIQRPRLSTGTMQRPMLPAGMMQRPVAPTATMRVQAPSVGATKLKQLRQTPSPSAGSFNAFGSAKQGLYGLRAAR
jgi:hypothetical protein